MLRKSESGLSLMEVIIILMVLGLVTYIVFPKFKTMMYQSREGRTKANLGDIRGALAIYYSDNFGLYPTDGGSPEERLVTQLTPHYIKAIPPVDLPHFFPENLNTVQDRFNEKGDWMYQMLNGFVTVNSFNVDTHGSSLSTW